MCVCIRIQMYELIQTTDCSHHRHGAHQADEPARPRQEADSSSSGDDSAGKRRQTGNLHQRTRPQNTTRSTSSSRSRPKYIKQNTAVTTATTNVRGGQQPQQVAAPRQQTESSQSEIQQQRCRLSYVGGYQTEGEGEQKRRSSPSRSTFSPLPNFPPPPPPPPPPPLLPRHLRLPGSRSRRRADPGSIRSRRRPSSK